MTDKIQNYGSYPSDLTLNYKLGADLGHYGLLFWQKPLKVLIVMVKKNTDSSEFLISDLVIIAVVLGISLMVLLGLLAKDWVRWSSDNVIVLGDGYELCGEANQCASADISANIDLLDFDISNSTTKFQISIDIPEISGEYSGVQYSELVIHQNEIPERTFYVRSPELSSEIYHPWRLNADGTKSNSYHRKVLDSYVFLQKAYSVGYFPYERHEISFSLFLQGSYKDSDGELSRNKKIPISPSFSSSLDRYSVDVDMSSDEQEDYKNNVKVVIKEISLYKTLYPISLILLSIFAVSIVLVEDVSSLVRNSVSVFLGIWTSREIFVPNEIPLYLTVMVDQSLLIIYFVFGIGVVFWSMVNLYKFIEDRISNDQSLM